jgi:hypothetical protein
MADHQLGEDWALVNMADEIIQTAYESVHHPDYPTEEVETATGKSA